MAKTITVKAIPESNGHGFEVTMMDLKSLLEQKKARPSRWMDKMDNYCAGRTDR